MHIRRAVDADRDPDIELDKDVDDLVGKEYSIRLHVNPAVRRKCRAKLAAQASQTIDPD
jgi:hypothetical protein